MKRTFGERGHESEQIDPDDGSAGVKGHCNVVDRTAHVHVKCLDVTSLVRDGTRATIFGPGTINGVPMTYRIDVDDQGEPGRGRDTFNIMTDSGYRAGGILAGGNVQVRLTPYPPAISQDQGGEDGQERTH